MKKIETFEQLQQEKKLSRQKIAQLEFLIEEDIEEIKNSLNPIKAAGNAIKNVISSENDGVISESIGLTVDSLIKRLLLRKSNWAFKFIVAFFLKNYLRNSISKNSGSILDWIKVKLRKNRDKNPREHFYDSSMSSDWET